MAAPGTPPPQNLTFTDLLARPNFCLSSNWIWHKKETFSVLLSNREKNRMDSLGFFFAWGLLYLDPFTTFNPKLPSQFNHLIQIYQLTNLFQILLCSKKKFSTLYGGTYLLHSFDHSTTTPWLSFCLAPFFVALLLLIQRRFCPQSFLVSWGNKNMEFNFLH